MGKKEQEEGRQGMPTHTPTSVVQGAGPVGGDDHDDNGGKSDKIGEEHVHRLLLPGGGGRKIVAFEDFENIEGKEGEGSDGLRVRVAVFAAVLSQVGVPRGGVWGMDEFIKRRNTGALEPAQGQNSASLLPAIPHSLPFLQVVIVLVGRSFDAKDVLELGKPNVKRGTGCEPSHHGMTQKANDLDIVKEGGREGGRGEIYE